MAHWDARVLSYFMTYGQNGEQKIGVNFEKWGEVPLNLRKKGKSLLKNITKRAANFKTLRIRSH